MVKSLLSVIAKQIIIGFFLLILPILSYSANYYWRAVAADNLFTNVGNWETSPGGGLSPSLAPSVNDDVFFPVASTITSIQLNSGNCRDFNVTAAIPTAFLFTGSLTAINGSLNCPNGNATFNFSGTQNFTGSGSHFINIGTSAIRLSGLMNFNNGTGLGSYLLMGPLNTNGVLTFNAQSFNTNGFPMSANEIVISGNTAKTIDFSNSLITINKIGFLFGTIQFLSPHTTTSYTFTGTHIVLNDSATTRKSSVIINPGVQIVLDTLTFNKTTTTTNTGVISVNASSTSPATITLNTLRLNVANLSLGANRFDNTSGTLAEGILNIANILFLRQCQITADRKFTLNVGAITEAPICSGQSAIVSVGYAPISINPTSPIVTNNLAYYGVTFGGSGITTSISNDLGNNTGSITWAAPISGISYWWVGGSGNWNDPSKWSILGSGGLPQTALGCVPTIYDTVIFDASSFSASQTVTIANGNAYCNNISWLGANLGLLDGGSLVSGDIYTGNLFIKADANFTGARGIGANLFYVGAGTHTITSGSFFSYSSPAIKIMSTGTRSLTDNLTGSPTNTYLQHTAGSFNSAGFTIDIANFCSRSFPELASNTRTLSLANSQINIRDIVNSVVIGRRHLDLSFLSAFNASNSEFRIHSTDPSCNFFITKGNSAASYLATVDFNDISFVGTSGTPLFYTSTVGGGSYTANFNNINFASNAQIISVGGGLITHNVNNYNLTSGATYSFSQSSGTSPTFNVLNNINHSVSGCAELVRIQSRVPGTQARINKSSGTLNVNGAIISDINAVGVTMNVLNGVDAGNNSNVAITAAASRTMYWVNNAGNWSDGTGHWSIGVSGGSPAVTNPLGCIPRVVDNAVFDNNSFSLSSQTITLNVDGNCRNMLWTSAAGSNTPIFAGIGTRNLNIYGSIELGTGMVSSYTGRIYMQGISSSAMSQTIDMNGVSTNGSIWMSGGGRYDLIDSIRIITADQGIRLERGNFVTNGHNIYSGAMALDATGSNGANIANSYIRLFSVGNVGIGTSRAYTASHNASGSWNALGSTIETTSGTISIDNSNPISYGSIIMNGGANLLGNASQPITFNYVDWLTTPSIFAGGSLMDGRFVIDTLRYPISSLNTFQTGGLRSYSINDTLIAFGTPCNPTFLRSANPGSAVTLNNSSCNFDFNFVNLRDISAGTCTAAQNKSIGTDEGGNSNWTITSIPALTKLGNDTAIVCAGPSITLDAIGFGTIPGISYTWNTGSTSRSINVNMADTYSIVVNYGAGCEVSDSLIVSCSSILPLSTLKLNAIALKESNQLNWETLSESKLSHFLIERSSDGIIFETIGQVQASGSAGFASKYSFWDREPMAGANLYRIKQYALDAQLHYSNTVNIYRKASHATIELSPNPAYDNFEIKFSQKGSYDLRILNLLGGIILEEKINIQKANEVKNIPCRNWVNGIYLLQIQSEKEEGFILQKLQKE